jgi:tRNA (Thr-GGU) A37 N-methylase
MSFVVDPIGFVRGGRTDPEDDDWGRVEATIVIDGRFDTDTLAGVDSFSHLDIVFFFHQVDEDAVHLQARHPRGRDDWPAVGIFAQRAKRDPTGSA